MGHCRGKETQWFPPQPSGGDGVLVPGVEESSYAVSFPQKIWFFTQEGEKETLVP